MVIGSGMIAKAFSRHVTNERVLIFASGVANSRETDTNEFERESLALENALHDNPDKLLVYFSTCSVDDTEASGTPYVRHKLSMESLVTRSQQYYLICRLPQVVGVSSNRTTLTNYLYDRIVKNEHFVVWKNATRYLIDVVDVVKIVSYYCENRNLWNSTINIVSRRYSITEIVDVLSKITGSPANYSVVSKGTPYTIKSSISNQVLKELNITFDKAYLERMLVKYYA